MDTKRMKTVAMAGILLIVAPLAARAEVTRRDIHGVLVERPPVPRIVEHVRGPVPLTPLIPTCAPVGVCASVGVDVGCVPRLECATACPPVGVSVTAPCGPVRKIVEAPRRVVLEKEVRAGTPCREVVRPIHRGLRR